MDIQWNKEEHLVVAVSTGIDSMVLLYRLLHQYKSTYQKLTVLHVHHGLRRASDREAGFLKDYCQQHQIEVYVHRLDLSATIQAGRSIQNEARKERYQWFEDMIRKVGGDVLLTAHHFDDQLETIFHRIFTGRVFRSPLGMKKIEQRNGYRIVRPLLDEPKSDISAFQQAHDVPYFEDESNQDVKYTRNAIRNTLMPMIEEQPQLKTEHLNKLYEMHKAALAQFETMAEEYIQTHVKKTHEKYEMSLSSFNKCPEHVKMMILDKLIQKWDAFATMSDAQYQDWFAKMAQPISQLLLYATNTWRILIVYDKLILSAEEGSPLLDVVQMNQEGRYKFGAYQIELSSKGEICFPLYIRTRQNGDRVELMPQGHKKVSRLMIDAKIPQEDRERIPLVVDANGQILAVGTLYQHANYNHLLNIVFLGDEEHEK
ncbi:tRNA lysidine(34) synthetase TilS [Staphylococcus chromogenes]|uniref:tRNA(Ile)-lysidine synthase n=1 Tax=Staphylococcus chromogenes TaxID=46126 RepID=A0AAE5W873_STACR|nr:tRNA lysidine(34) synthetase TilS [Staphylococcus chromogenes]MBV5192277.1 tRNA lysidine(34) synthetase TilS [Staphylococcus chromogenes]MBW3133295.1 tRNA lysidine(34) synthetase TilS [Staphylococcus chromogenes]PTF37395.1 tRNA lysidine(34) synthetase TilS [Staphylococcus chromogenes]PTF48266.1 tRNA lysidine(34) synthetase TilS [Staphylococcus chromogenes]PTF51494.1 tRNA lysidine(34) synthetase TilS [Staphylococcus chromogenes]